MPPLLNNDFLDDDDLPVLNSVVRGGNESVIQSTRQDRLVSDQLEALRRNTKVHFNLPDIPGLAVDPEALPIEDELDDTQQFYPPLKALPSAQPSSSDPVACEDDGIELLIDELVDRHITELRQDIRSLLDRARRLS
ncbi:MAG: hypothetical protein V3U76_14315 [Granulosicoccus sp.]